MEVNSNQRMLKSGPLVAFLAASLISLMFAGGASDALAEKPRFCRGTNIAAIKPGARGPLVHGISASLQSKRLEPGENLYARLINYGASRATYGPQHRIERYTDSQWTIDPASPHGPWHKVFWLLPSEKAGRCFRYMVPVDQPTGIYRFVIPVKTDRGRSGRTVVFRVG